MDIDPAVFNKLVWMVGLTAAIVAAGISALFQLINGWRERVAADKRHLRDLALKAAIVQWEHEVAKVDQENRNMGRMDPPKTLGEVHFDMILLKKIKMIETFSKKNLSQGDIQKGIKEMNAIGSAIRREVSVRKAKADEPDHPDQPET